MAACLTRARGQAIGYRPQLRTARFWGNSGQYSRRRAWLGTAQHNRHVITDRADGSRRLPVGSTERPAITGHISGLSARVLGGTVRSRGIWPELASQRR